MKKTLATLALTVAVVSSGLAQGFVIFSNPGSQKISTNSVVNGLAAGSISANGGTVASTYYFALFYSAAATTVSGSSAAVAGAGNYVVNDNNWTFDNPSSGQAGGFTFGPGYATNTLAGQFNSEFVDGSQSGTLVPFTTAAQFVVVGWSGAIGSTIASLQSYLANPTFNAWVGESAVSGAITPGNPDGAPPSSAAALFGSSAPQMQKFLLGEIAPVPEPTTIALASLGGLSLLAFRRRNKA